MTSYLLGELAELVGGRVVGQDDLSISSLGTLESARRGSLSHLSSASYRRFLAGTRASAVLLAESDLPCCPCSAIVVEDPYLAFATLSRLFETSPRPQPGVHPSAWVAAGACLADDVSIGPGAVIEADVSIGAASSIGANSVIGAGAQIGSQVRIMPGVVIYHGVVIGDRSQVHSGAVIGADGFGFAPDAAGNLHAIAQVGSVQIGRDVSIGAGTTIDRGAIEDTRIGDGVKIDNQVQVGHNCEIGDHSILCGCVGLAGSTRIGKHCVLAGAVGVAGKGPVEIADGVTVSAMTHVARSIERPGTYSGGIPQSENSRWRRNLIRFNDLDELAKRVSRLEKSS